jgi:hypothetical protein
MLLVVIAALASALVVLHYRSHREMARLAVELRRAEINARYAEIEASSAPRLAEFGPAKCPEGGAEADRYRARRHPPAVTAS